MGGHGQGERGEGARYGWTWAGREERALGMGGHGQGERGEGARYAWVDMGRERERSPTPRGAGHRLPLTPQAKHNTTLHPYPEL